MPKPSFLISKSTAVAAVALLALSGCASNAASEAAESTPSAPASSETSYPITIEHALGTTEITQKAERIATVNWSNQEVPLALGVVPVGMAAANFGDDDGDGILPWVDEALTELGGETPVLFNEDDGIDFEAVADTNPDLILAAYSGLTAEDYATLSEIAPVVAYPEAAWATSWRDNIALSSKAMGMEAEGKELITGIETEIKEGLAEHPEIEGTSAMFVTHVDPTNLSEVNFYTTHDTRTAFFSDLGMDTPAAVATASKGAVAFAGKISAERVDDLADVDVIVTYGDKKLIETLEKDPLLSKMPAVKNGAVVALDGSGPLGTAANPTPLAISWVLDDYLDLLNDAAQTVAK
ncbi:iron-siderophore ABC transporter substrate-binding protein [Arthrobacter sp. MYb213]|uniref:iron-siderophore ABC transporter substrate-binding protein n=1 Tax=Arthrobacter sp. MYb213 TaxID=1848595 RepID=UPI000CFAA459|nr:iron-siderophore ABC transporter substrate-binding protein [Arthrobacter sp. MYb213]PRB72785.1 ABC transporter substrate-binding protein [Arthrobacter sp. MYb213]